MELIKTILLVDDDEEECELIQAIIRDSWTNCQIECVHSRQQMLSYLDNASTLPILILMDSQIVPNTGYELVKELRADQRFRRIPILILTGSPSPKQVDDYYDIGVNAYLLKPNSMQEYRYLLSQVRTFWLDVAVTPNR